MRAVGRLVALVGAMLAMALIGAAPATAFSSITETGTRGDWGVPDNPVVGQEGARCYYNNGTGGGSLLTRVRVSAPIIWGAYPNMTWVGWRFAILRSIDGGTTYKSAYRSPIWKDRANQNVAADGFSFKSWYPATPKAEAMIRVQVTLFWYKPGTKSIIEGKAVGQDDNYSVKFPGSTPSGTGSFCYTIEA